MSCEFRDLYIRLFHLYEQIGGDVDKLKLFSPIEKVANYFAIKPGEDSLARKEDVRFNPEAKLFNRTMKQIKDFPKISNGFLDIKQLGKFKAEGMETRRLGLGEKMLLRSTLVEKHRILAEMIRREKIKMDLIKLV